mmetsp:Transcript_57655/g.158821  ORF Transcript_57655/g.158821 Transcript_57655/m.158821 type:complete len:1739 (-) Transcript_57655:67-5283(-)
MLFRGGKEIRNKEKITQSKRAQGDGFVGIIYKGRPYDFAVNSLGIFSETNRLRVWALDVVTSSWFDRTILFFIGLNSAFLALTDYEHIDSDGEPTTKGSWQNTMIEGTEPIFTTVFTFECIVKIVAMGFISNTGSYINDRWNKLDFLVVITSLLTVDDSSFLPNVSSLRTFRVLRPLRSLSSIPELQHIVETMLKSLPELGNVVIVLCFLFALFGILGMQLYSGRQHFRCRLTPYPVTLDWSPDLDDALDFHRYSCLNVSDPESLNFNILDDDNTWQKSASPWATRQQCYWPVATNDVRICDPTDPSFDSPEHSCLHRSINRTEWRWCGSNYDARGNERFKGPATIEAFQDDDNYGRSRVRLKTEELAKAATYVDSLNWGFTNFDNFAVAFLSVFQCITMEGWTEIMYQLMDGYSAVGAAFYFSILILFGSLFVMNLLLAVMEGNFRMPIDEKAPDEDTAQEDGETPSGNQSPSKPSAFEIVPQEADEVRAAEDTAITVVEPVQSEKKEELHPAFAAIRKRLQDIVLAAWFSTGVTGLIVANTVILSMDHHDMDTDLETNLEVCNFVLTLCFAIEMVLKLVALGPRGYAEDSFNIFDGVIVLISLVELIALPPDFLSGAGGDDDGVSDNGGGAISVLRSFRLFRVFKLAKDWKQMRDLLAKIVKTVVDIMYFVLLLILYIFIFALIGCQFFANRLRFDANGYVVELGNEGWETATVPDLHFDSFAQALITVFCILSAENWNQVMYDCWRATGWMSVMYFVLLVTSGMLIVMNLCIAILLGNLTESAAEEEEEEPEGGGEGAGASEEGSGAVVPVMSADDSVQAEEGGEANGGGADPLAPATAKRTLFIFSQTNPVRIWCAKVSSHPKFDTAVLVLIVISSLLLALDNPLMDPESDLKKFLVYTDYVMTTLFTMEMLLKIVTVGLVAGKGAYLRDNWNVLDFVVVLISIISIFAGNVKGLKSLRTLRALRALRPLRVVKRFPGLRIVVNAMFAAIPDVMNVSAVCLLFFLIFSIFAVNFFKGQLRSCSGDVYDYVIAQNASLTNFMTEPKAWKDMGTDEQSWFLAGSPVTDLFDSCTTNTSACCPSVWPDALGAEPTSQEVCTCWGGDWERVVPQSFDNVLVGLLTLVEISTTEGWVDVMLAAVASTGVDMEPVRDNNLWWAVFFIFFMMVGSYLVMNLFVGVVVDNFNSVRKQAEGHESLLTEAQQAWVKTQQTAAKFKPKKKLYPPASKFGQWCFKIVLTKDFEWAIMSCIIVNTCVMAATYFGMPEDYEAALNYMNYVFAAVFTVEAIMKIAAMKRNYFSDNWNMFDFFIVLGTGMGYILMWATGSGAGGIATIVRSFRVGRILRLIQGAKGLNRLFNTLILTLPGLSNISALLCLLLFIFTVMSMQLFAKIQYQGDLDEHANFRSFPRALLVLFRCATGEDWNGLMHDLAKQADGCEEDPEYDTAWNDPDFDSDKNPPYCGFIDVPGCIPLNGCGSNGAIPFLFLFNFVVSFVFLNLFIGVILEGFDLANESFGVSEEDFVSFSAHWSEYDPEATCYVHVDEVKNFLETLHKPWGFGNELVSDAELTKKVLELDLPVFKERVHFKDVLMGLAETVVKEDLMRKGVETSMANEELLARELGSSGRRNSSEDGGLSTSDSAVLAARVLTNYVRVKIIMRVRLKKLAEEHRILVLQEAQSRQAAGFGSPSAVNRFESPWVDQPRRSSRRDSIRKEKSSSRKNSAGRKMPHRPLPRGDS